MERRRPACPARRRGTGPALGPPPAAAHLGLPRSSRARTFPFRPPGGAGSHRRRMKTREFTEDGLHIVAIEGEIDLARSPELREVLHAHAKARRPALIVDFQGVSYVDSSGLATLIEYVRKAQAYRGRFALVHVNERVQTIFDLVRLREFLSIYPTLADAKTALLAPPGA